MSCTRPSCCRPLTSGLSLVSQKTPTPPHILSPLNPLSSSEASSPTQASQAVTSLEVTTVQLQLCSLPRERAILENHVEMSPDHPLWPQLSSCWHPCSSALGPSFTFIKSHLHHCSIHPGPWVPLFFPIANPRAIIIINP